MIYKSEQGFVRRRSFVIIMFLVVGLIASVVRSISAENTGTNLTVSPTFELDEMIAKFEADANTNLEKNTLSADNLSVWENDLREAKKKGKTLWGSEKWMKDTKYYQSLDTCKLAEECFDRPIYCEFMAFADRPEISFARLKIMHNGFAELFKREDMWKGILHVYEYLGAKLNPQEEWKKYFTPGGNLGALNYLYELPEFKAQVKGREKLFLDANINALKQFKSVLEWFENNNPQGPLVFFAEPCEVAQTALMLYKQVNPQEYAKVAPGIESIRWSKEQHRKDVINFSDLVIRNIKQ